MISEITMVMPTNELLIIHMRKNNITIGTEAYNTIIDYSIKYAKALVYDIYGNGHDVLDEFFNLLGITNPYVKPEWERIIHIVSNEILTHLIMSNTLDWVVYHVDSTPRIIRIHAMLVI